MSDSAKRYFVAAAEMYDEPHPEWRTVEVVRVSDLTDESPAATVDPRVRKDGLCAGCGKPRPKHRVKARGPNKQQPNATSLARNIWLYELEKDPWCSSKCAREFHGAQLASDADDLTETRAASGRKSAARFRQAAV